MPNIPENLRKHPRLNDSMEVDEEAPDINKIVSDFKAIPDKNVDSLSKFLVDFLQATNNCNIVVKDLKERVVAVEVKSDLHEERMNHIEDQIKAIEDTQKTSEETLEEKIKKLDKVDEISTQCSKNSSNVFFIQQAMMETDMILKDFPSKPDPDIVLENFLQIFDLNKDTVREHYHVAYEVNNNKSNDEMPSSSAAPKSKILHFVVIKFKSKTTKTDVFNIKKKRGPLFLSELLPTMESSKKTVIRCSNKLSKFNLLVQRTLYKAVDEKRVFAYRYHNHLFQVQITETSKWIRIDSYEALKPFKPAKKAK